MRLGDWLCNKCGNHNYASRVNCNKCGAATDVCDTNSLSFGAVVAAGAGKNRAGPYAAGTAPPARPTSAAGPYAAGTAPTARPASASGPSVAGTALLARPASAAMRPGDWMCPSCSNHNYADKVACNRCKQPKPADDRGGCHEHLFVAGAYASMALQAQAPLTPQPQPAVSSTRPGDWICENCQNVNYASRQVCNKCQTPRNSSQINGAGMNGMRPGDWICKSCNNHNYASKEICNKCGGPKSEGYVNTSNMRPGDWICPSCNNHNYADKLGCNRCGTQKPEGLGEERRKKANTGMRPTLEAALRRKGDWNCDACGDLQFARNTSCRMCGADKPSTTEDSISVAPGAHGAATCFR